MTDMRRVTISMPDALDKQILSLRAEQTKRVRERGGDPFERKKEAAPAEAERQKEENKDKQEIDSDSYHAMEAAS